MSGEYRGEVQKFSVLSRPPGEEEKQLLQERDLPEPPLAKEKEEKERKQNDDALSAASPWVWIQLLIWDCALQVLLQQLPDFYFSSSMCNLL